MLWEIRRESWSRGRADFSFKKVVGIDLFAKVTIVQRFKAGEEKVSLWDIDG